jgi:hypothetical protein
MYHAVWYKKAERAMDELSVADNQFEERSVQKSNNGAWIVVLLSKETAHVSATIAARHKSPPDGSIQQHGRQP